MATATKMSLLKKKDCFINSNGTEHSHLKCQRLTQADNDKNYDCSYSLLNHAYALINVNPVEGGGGCGQGEGI